MNINDEIYENVFGMSIVIDLNDSSSWLKELKEKTTGQISTWFIKDIKKKTIFVK